jgi:hypothetical protein
MPKFISAFALIVAVGPQAPQLRLGLHLRANCSGDVPIADAEDTAAPAQAFVAPAGIPVDRIVV